MIDDPVATRSTDERSRAAVLVLPVLQLVAVLVSWWSIVNELVRLDADSCLNVPPSTPGLKFVGVALLGLLVGRYSGALRFFSANDSRPLSDRDPASVLLGRAALALVFLALVPISVYEAIGVYQPVSGYEPITYYVRCAIWIDNNLAGGFRTMIILFVVGFLFGQWLWAWHPDNSSTRRRHERELPKSRTV
jgi:hypothetical protein